MSKSTLLKSTLAEVKTLYNKQNIAQNPTNINFS